MNVKKQKLLWGSLLILAVAVTAFFFVRSRTKEPIEPAGEPTVESAGSSDIFSNMETTDLEGNAADKAIFAENKLTLVNVWNVGCTPCVEEIPVLDKLNKEYAGKGVAIKGLYYGLKEGISEEDRKEAERILSEADADYQQLLVSKDMLNSDTMKAFAVFPTSYLVDSEGTIVEEIAGSNDYEGWKAVLEDALKKVEKNA